MILGLDTVGIRRILRSREGWRQEELASDRLKVPLIFPISRRSFGAVLMVVVSAWALILIELVLVELFFPELLLE